MEHYHTDPPIRTKIDLIDEIGKIIHHLHLGELTAANSLIDNLKNRCTILNEQIQNDVQVFSEAIQFQLVYDPQHLITPEIEEAADQLINDLVG